MGNEKRLPGTIEEIEIGNNGDLRIDYLDEGRNLKFFRVGDIIEFYDLLTDKFIEYKERLNSRAKQCDYCLKKGLEQKAQGGSE